VRVPGFGLRTGAAIPLGPRITPGLKRPTRGSGGPGQPSPPIWPCSARGLPCRPDYSETRWALTPPFHPYRSAVLQPTPERQARDGHRPPPAVCFLWHFPWPSPRGLDPLALPGALPCGVRTFLAPTRVGARPPGSPVTLNHFSTGFPTGPRGASRTLPRSES
jgi:hypothetical protein